MTIELDSEVYDTLHFSALAFGGITWGVFCDRASDGLSYNLDCPNCAHGLLMAAEGKPYPYHGLSQRLFAAGVSGGDSDGRANGQGG